MKSECSILSVAKDFTSNKEYKKALSCYRLFKVVNEDLADIVIVNEIFLQKKIKDSCDVGQIIMVIPVFDNMDYTLKCFWKVIKNSPFDVRVDIIQGTAEKSYLLARFDVDDLNAYQSLTYSNDTLDIKFFLEKTCFFDSQFYQNQYKSTLNGLDALTHFVQYGFAEGRLPARWFDLHVGSGQKISKIVTEAAHSRASRDICPKVSVLVPVYNNAEYLHECIDSVLGQTLKNIEIIIINDGSTDQKAIDILNDYANKDHRIRLIHKKNTGYGHSMNCGLYSAKGEYIGILESDDYIHEEMYNKMSNIAELENVHFVKCNSRRFTGIGEGRTFEDLITVKSVKHYNVILNTHKDISLLKMYNTNTNGIFNRKFLNQHGIKFNETPGASFQDNGFWFQTFAWATRFYCIQDFFYMIRRDNPNSSVMSKEKVYCICDEYSFIHNFLKKNPELEKLFIKMFFWKKYGNYLFAYKRIDKKYKMDFMLRFSEEFQSAYKEGFLDKTVFNEHWEDLMRIVNLNQGLQKELIKAEKMISVAYISDHGYMIPTFVSITSLIKNSSLEFSYNIYLLYTEFDEVTLKLFKSMQTSNIKIIFIDVTSFLKKIPTKHIITNKKVTNTALIKFFLPNILSLLDKVLYIDGDTIVLSDLSELFFKEIPDHYCAAIQDAPWGLYSKKKIKEISFQQHYFNSGVMLLNTKKMRNNSISEKLIHAKSWLTTSLMDQDAFNYVMYGAVKFLELKNNLMIDALYRHILKGKISVEFINSKTSSSYSDFDSFIHTASIIHFGSYYKPWNYYDLMCSDVWFLYFRQSPINHLELHRKSRLKKYLTQEQKII